MWPIVHNTTIFSLVLAQIIALGVFGLKESPVASGFMIPLVILTLLFNEYCRQRFHPLFRNFPAQVGGIPSYSYSTIILQIVKWKFSFVWKNLPTIYVAAQTAFIPNSLCQDYETCQN